MTRRHAESTLAGALPCSLRRLRVGRVDPPGRQRRPTAAPPTTTAPCPPTRSPSPGRDDRRRTTTTVDRRRRRRRHAARRRCQPCPVDALDAADGAGRDHVLARPADRARGRARSRSPTCTTPARTAVRVELQNQSGYEQTIDKYFQSSQDEPARPRAVARVHGPADRRRRHGDPDRRVHRGRAASTSSPFLPRALAPTRPRACSGRCRSTSATRCSTTTRRCSRRPASIPTPADHARGAARRLAEDRRLRRRDVRHRPRHRASTRAAAGSSSSGSPSAGELYADNGNGRSAPATQVLYDGPVGRRAADRRCSR